jgi:predicted PolB exonuclease-like 3'-5' exonuclease
MTSITRQPKILIYDLETLPNKGYFFGIFDQNINPNFITQERSIVTIAYKWMGDKKAKSLSVADFDMTDPYDDSKLLKAFIDIYNQADYTVAHYGDKFDTKFLHTRALLNNLESPAPVSQIDTYKLVKKHFNLNSNRLDYIGKKLGLGGKMPMDWGYWVRCAEGDLKAIDKMATYNRQDVDLLEAVFKKLMPHTPSKINQHLFGAGLTSCKHCGSSDVEMRGYYHTATKTNHRFVCKKCSSWGKITIKELTPSEESTTI